MRPSASANSTSSSTPAAQQLQRQLKPQPLGQNVPQARSRDAQMNHGASRAPSSSGSLGHDGYMLSSSSATSSSLTSEGSDPLLDLFYKYFYPSHPFVLPADMRGRLPEFLKAVMRFGGSHFGAHANRDALKNAAIAQILPNAPDNGFKVQAFALLAMISFSRNEQEEGGAFLKSAIALALLLGLHQKQFAVRFGSNDPTMEESWRRTWWDLFIVEGLISSFTGQMETSKLQDITTDVFLPGDCESYNACSPSKHLRSVQEMQDRAFSDDDFQWSSFAYKIEAMYLLRSVGALGADSFGGTSSYVETLDQRLSNFRLSLPGNKKEGLTPNGQVDEVMFGALMTASCAEIALHRPRSSLVYIRNHYPTACTPEETQGLTAVEYRSHDAKAIRAANAITNLLTVPSAPILHTPCFTCALTVATTVQLPAMVQNRTIEGAAFKDRIQLAINAMGSISEVWPMAIATKSQIASFARDILKSGTDPNLLEAALPPQQSTTPSDSLSTSQPFDEDSYVENQDWFMELVGGDDCGLTEAEVNAWLQSTSDTSIG